MIKLFRFFQLFTAIMFFSGCALFKPVEYQTVDGIALEKLELDYAFDDEKREITLAHNNNIFRLNYGRRIAKFNDIKIWFFDPAKFDGDEVIRMKTANIEKIINPLMSENYSLPSPVKRIVLDPGHGDHDSGAVGKISKEKDLNLALALKTKTELEKRGFEVFMTRSDDTFIPLDDRSKFAEEKKADIFISIHHNAALVPEANGIEVFALSPAGVASTHDNGGKVAGELRGNQFDNANINLAYLVQQHVMSSVKANDRGIKFARYRVLVLAPCPAVLFEAGFMSNEKEEKELNQSSRHEKTASAIAEAVLKFAKKQ